MSKNHDIIEIAGELRGESDKAYRLFDGKKTEWVPKSQCEWDEKDKTMQMPEWLATDKGFL
jgi:hypothetical protein